MALPKGKSTAPITRWLLPLFREDEDIVYATRNSGVNMRETVRSLSAVGVRRLRGAAPSKIVATLRSNAEQKNLPKSVKAAII